MVTFYVVNLFSEQIKIWYSLGWLNFGNNKFLIDCLQNVYLAHKNDHKRKISVHIHFCLQDPY